MLYSIVQAFQSCYSLNQESSFLPSPNNNILFFKTQFRYYFLHLLSFELYSNPEFNTLSYTLVKKALLVVLQKHFLGVPVVA